MRDFGDLDLPELEYGEVSTSFSARLDWALRQQGVPNGAYLPADRKISVFDLARDYSCYDGEETRVANIPAQVQINAFSALSSNSGGIHILSSIGSDKYAQACALFKYAHALVDYYRPENYHQNEKAKCSPPLWLTLTSGWELVDAAKAARKARTAPTMVVLSNVVDSSSPSRRELARDLLTLYDCSTRVLATASQNPHAVAWNTHLPIDGGIFLAGRQRDAR